MLLRDCGGINFRMEDECGIKATLCEMRNESSLKFNLLGLLVRAQMCARK